jgi:hypothetical protein
MRGYLQVCALVISAAYRLVQSWSPDLALSECCVLQFYDRVKQSVNFLEEHICGLS